jgi:hypothetical protein
MEKNLEQHFFVHLLTNQSPFNKTTFGLTQSSLAKMTNTHSYYGDCVILFLCFQKAYSSEIGSVLKNCAL